MAHPTNADIIRRAHRLLGTLANGGEPTGDEAADSMERLQSTMLEQVGLLVRARWCDRTVTADYTACEGQRIAISGVGLTITLPVMVSPLGGCTRPPLNFARVQILGDAGNVGVWVYVASLGTWRQVDGRAISDDFPFGLEDVDGMAAQLAVAIQDEYGESFRAGQTTVLKSSASKAAFRSRFLAAAPTDWTRPSDVRTTCWPDYV